MASCNFTLTVYITQRSYVERNYTETQNISRELMDYYFGICISNCFASGVRICCWFVTGFHLKIGRKTSGNCKFAT